MIRDDDRAIRAWDDPKYAQGGRHQREKKLGNSDPSNRRGRPSDADDACQDSFPPHTLRKNEFVSDFDTPNPANHDAAAMATTHGHIAMTDSRPSPTLVAISVPRANHKTQLMTW